MSRKGKALPDGWCWATLGDSSVATIIMGQSPPGSTYNVERNGLPFFQGKADFEDVSPIERVWCTAPKKIAEQGDILLSVRAPVGPTNIANQQSCIGRGLASVRGERNAITTYLYYWFKRIEPWLREQGEGSTFKAIGKEHVEELQLPLPPLPVQERIVQILQKADEIRRKRKGAMELTDAILPAIFHEMFGDPTSNPKGYKRATIGQVTTLVTSGYTPRGGASNYVEGGPLLIRSQNVRMLRLDLLDCAHVSEEIHQKMARIRVMPGDVLLNITGASIGRVAWASEDILPASVNQHVCIIRTKKDIVAPEYLAYCLATPWYQHIILNAPGSAQTGFNHARVRALDILVPPMPIQNAFVMQVQALRETRDKCLAAMEHVQKSFQGLLARAFTGELTAEWEAANAGVIDAGTAFHERLPRLLILALLAEKAKRASRATAEVLVTALMKYAFLLQMEGNHRRRLYHFVPYHYGPFTKGLYTDLEKLQQEGLVIVDEYSDEDKTKITLTDPAKAEQALSELSQDLKDDADKIVETYGNLDHNTLLKTVYEKYPAYAKKSRLRGHALRSRGRKVKTE